MKTGRQTVISGITDLTNLLGTETDIYRNQVRLGLFFSALPATVVPRSAHPGRAA